MSADLTPERRAEIEDRIAHHRFVQHAHEDVPALWQALQQAERERDLLEETARRLTAERDRLQAALETFGDHDGGCDEFWENGASCSCGFAKALAAARATAGRD